MSAAGLVGRRELPGRVDRGRARWGMDALARVVASTGVDDVVERLAGLPGADLTTLLLAVARVRNERRSPADVLRQAGTDRFVVPSDLDGRAYEGLVTTLVDALPSAFELVVLSPLAAAGTCSTLATVSPDKVVTTVRRTEVAADPTNALAVEAARRRRAGEGGVIRLAAVQRVVRAQRFEVGAAHFGICGLMTAVRGDDAEALAEHVQAIVDLCAAAGATELEVGLTDLGAAPSIHVQGANLRHAPERESGRGYYRGACFKVHGVVGGRRLELADGGCTGWTGHLLADRRERTVISGLGIDRLLPRAGDPMSSTPP